MDNTWFIYYLLLMIIILYLPWKRRKRYAAKRIMKKGKINNSQRSAGKIMKELAERFIGKDVYINLLDGRADGVIKEVTDNGIVLENKNGVQVVNLDYVVKLHYKHTHNRRQRVLPQKSTNGLLRQIAEATCLNGRGVYGRMLHIFRTIL